MSLKDWYEQKTLNDPLLPILRTLRDKKICIMGGCGQVGSHTITKLYELDFPVDNIYVNDNLSLGKTENLPEELRGLVDTRSHLEFARDPRCTPEIVIFVGGRSSAPHFKGLPEVMEEIENWKAILEWCARERIRLIFASTSSLCKVRPAVETQRVWPGSLYELTKLMMEEMAIQQALSEGLVVQVCRFFSVYGVTEQHKGDFGNLYTQILSHAKKGVEFEVWGQDGVFEPGDQTRDTIFATEVARAILFLLTLEPEPTLQDISSLTYNVGQGKPVSVREMIEQVSAVVPKTQKPRIVETEVPSEVKNYVVHTWGDPQKLIQAGFEPVFTNHQDNLRFINWALSEVGRYWSTVDTIRTSLTSKEQTDKLQGGKTSSSQGD